jgi:hypothetical protein
MKQLLTILLLLSFINLKAQTEKASAVDSVFTGKILIDKENRTKIYLTNFQQTLDSTGVYTTTYTFGTKNRRPTFDVNVRMNFDAPLIHDGPIGFQYGPVGVGRYSGSGALRNNSYLFMQGQWTSASHHFFIKIKSKQKVKPVITGLDGQSAF